MLAIEFSNRQTRYPVDETRLVEAARLVLTEEQIQDGCVSLVVVDDATIHALNRRYLEHDFPTDVLSFVLQPGPEHLEGEVIVSAETAASASQQYGWSADDELLLYVVHGALHLVDYDDQTPAARSAMRERERRYLARFQLTPRYADEG
jgi:probable rRNA maturation factor